MGVELRKAGVMIINNKTLLVRSQAALTAKDSLTVVVGGCSVQEQSCRRSEGMRIVQALDQKAAMVKHHPTHQLLVHTDVHLPATPNSAEVVTSISDHTH